TIGHGAFGKVFLVNKIDTEEIYAMKVYEKMSLFENNILMKVISERKILKDVHSEFIVKLSYAFQAENKIYLLMEFVQGGELHQYLKKLIKFDENKTKFYTAQIILALEILHQNNILYRDLKLENVLLGQDGYIKLTDFGISKEYIKGEDKTNTFCGTPEYMAPEQIQNLGHNKKVDLWQLGILIYEMLCGSTPFKNSSCRNNKEVMFSNIINLNYNFPYFVSNSARGLIQGLLQKEPNNRLSFDQIKQQKFFENFDWESLKKKKIEPEYKPPPRTPIDLRNINQQAIQQSIVIDKYQDKNKEEANKQLVGFSYYQEMYLMLGTLFFGSTSYLVLRYQKEKNLNIHQQVKQFVQWKEILKQLNQQVIHWTLKSVQKVYLINKEIKQIYYLLQLDQKVTYILMQQQVVKNQKTQKIHKKRWNTIYLIMIYKHSQLKQKNQKNNKRLSYQINKFQKIQNFGKWNFQQLIWQILQESQCRIILGKYQKIIINSKKRNKKQIRIGGNNTSKNNTRFIKGIQLQKYKFKYERYQ
ncbi:ph-protein kinase domain protein, partial [Ichthyophthirius multifiliis]